MSVLTISLVNWISFPFLEEDLDEDLPVVFFFAITWKRFHPGLPEARRIRVHGIEMITMIGIF